MPDQEEGTNIDVMWRTPEVQTTLCEVKLSEADVGSAKNDQKHLRKLKEIYAPKLTHYVSPDELTPVRFFKSYQFYRNLLHAIRIPNARLIFLAPRSNRRLWNRLTKLVGEIPGEVRRGVSTVSIEDVVARLTSDSAVPKHLRQHVLALSEKYLV